MVWYGIVGFNVPIDTLQVISETINAYLTRQEIFYRYQSTEKKNSEH